MEIARILRNLCYTAKIPLLDRYKPKLFLAVLKTMTAKSQFVILSMSSQKMIYSNQNINHKS